MENPIEPIFIREQSPSFLNSKAMDARYVEAAFDEGARHRTATDPLFGFPVPDVMELYLNGA